MAFDPASVDMSPIIASVQDALKRAFEEGRQAGIAAILAAAQSPTQPSALKPTSAVDARPDSAKDRVARAPRGEVPRILDDMMAKRPGLTIQDYEAMLSDYDTLISVRSIGNELRRFENKKYRRDRFNWWPIAHQNQASDNPNQEASDA